MIMPLFSKKSFTHVKFQEEEGGVVYKINLKKAYDHVSWEFPRS